jgi:hypothetical protein
MNRQELENKLDEVALQDAYRYGCRTSAKEGIIGHILVKKNKQRPMTVYNFQNYEEAKERKKRYPFSVFVAEMVHRPLRPGEELYDYPNTEDYRYQESFEVATLEDVSDIMKRFGRDLSDILAVDDVFALWEPV